MKNKNTHLQNQFFSNPFTPLILIMVNAIQMLGETFEQNPLVQSKEMGRARPPKINTNLYLLPKVNVSND